MHLYLFGLSQTSFPSRLATPSCISAWRFSHLQVEEHSTFKSSSFSSNLIRYQYLSMSRWPHIRYSWWGISPLNRWNQWNNWRAIERSFVRPRWTIMGSWASRSKHVVIPFVKDTRMDKPRISHHDRDHSAKIKKLECLYVGTCNYFPRYSFLCCKIDRQV